MIDLQKIERMMFICSTLLTELGGQTGLDLNIQSLITEIVQTI